MIRRYLTTLSMIIVLAAGTMAHAEWVGVDGATKAEADVSVRQESASRTVIDITVPGVEISSQDIDGKEYSQVTLPGHWNLLDKGQPGLPFITSALIIPDSGTPTVRVTKSDWVEVATGSVLPSKGKILRTVDPATVPWTFGDIYANGGVFPTKTAQLATPYIVRDYRGVSLRVYPVRWDADRGVLEVARTITVEVETNGTGGINEKTPDQWTSIDTQYNNLYRQRFDNFNQTEKYTMLETDGPMLVVCYDAFIGTIQPWVEWKRSTGLQVEVISSGSVGGTTSGIQTAINDRYNSPAGLTYLVLVGDIAQIPTYTGTDEGADDDTRYGNLAGSDLYPDIFISRISAQNPDHVLTQTNKFIRYERDPDADGTWYHTGLGIASDQDGGTGITDYTRMEYLRTDLMGYNFTQVDQVYEPAGTGAQVGASVNAGVSIVNYMGHGSGSAWGNPTFSSTDINNLTNGWKTPWIIDVSCLNGGFANDQCFAETWMNAGNPTQPHGAVAIYSASTSTPWVPPTVMQGEAIDLLVAEQANVIGSLYYHGIMKLMDVYPGDAQSVEQYNIFGDCSLVVRTNTPTPLNVVHGGSVNLGATVWPVDTGAANAVVTLYSNGVLHGKGITDASGHVDVQLDNPLVVAGEVSLVVSGYNILTHVETLQAIVPVDIALNPTSIPVGVRTMVEITLTDPAKANDNVAIYIEGFGVEGLTAVTDVNGVATINVDPQFGETLTVRGREDGATFDMFTVELPVTGAMDLRDANIDAFVGPIGLTNALAPLFDGWVVGSAVDSGLTMVVTGCGLDVELTDPDQSVTAVVTPDATGTVEATLMKAGYQIYQRTIDCIEALGTLSGVMTDADNGNALLEGALVQIFAYPVAPGDTPLYEVESSATGAWEIAEEMAVAGYQIRISKFGYQEIRRHYILQFGANVTDFGMILAPAGVLSGVVTSAEDASPVDGTISIYRTDDDSLYAEVSTDPATGAYTTAALPFFEYRAVVKAQMFIPQSMNIVVDGPAVEQDFVMEATIGNILVVAHGSSRDGLISYPAKLDKNGNEIAPAAEVTYSRSGASIAATLTDLGYSVTSVTSTAYDFASWSEYNLVVVSAGNNSSGLSTGLRADLETYTGSGGHLLIEGGEVAYSHRTDTSFMANVLHIASWTRDSAGEVVVHDPDHFTMSMPNILTGTLNLNYASYGDGDGVIAASDAWMSGSWSSYATNASVVCYDPTPAPSGGQIVFFTFNQAALSEPAQTELLQNATNWLLAEEIGESSIAGSVDLAGSTDNSGVTVTLLPIGDTLITGTDGAYSFNEITEGTYTVEAVKVGYSTERASVSVAASEIVTGIDLNLVRTVIEEVTETPGLPIPDNNATGVTSTMMMDHYGDILGVEVDLDITHTYTGDIKVTLTSPAGTSVVLHDESGGSADNVVTTYPTLTTPAESLNAFLGEDMYGQWELLIVDSANNDTGTLVSWTLRITCPDFVTAVEDHNLPSVVTLDGNFPNPFNPSTEIVFSLPVSQHVELAVYNIQGRKVASLVNSKMGEGNQRVLWLGNDDKGHGVASGTYFYRLTTNSKTLTGKMLLIK